MLRKETVESSTFELLKMLQSEEVLQDARLVGGTALSLQIGHRTSEDLDLFTTEPFDAQDVALVLSEKYAFIPRIVRGRTIIGDIDGVKVDVIYHPFKWLDEPVMEDGVRMATTKDITAMKLHAIINSGQRPKDFVDVAYLSQLYSYDEMKAFLLEKYPQYDPIMADRALTYFEDIDPSSIPSIRMMNEKLDFGRIKLRLYLMSDEPYKVFRNSPLLVQGKQSHRNKRKKD